MLRRLQRGPVQRSTATIFFRSLFLILAICVEAGMIALRRDAAEIHHEDYMEAVQEVQAKKKGNLIYYA